MKISFFKKHFIWFGVLWIFTFVTSLFIRVEIQYWGGLEGEYYAIYGFPFAVATRQYDMWIPFLKQFDVVYLGVVLNFVFTAFLATGVMTAILFALQLRKRQA